MIFVLLMVLFVLAMPLSLAIGAVWLALDASSSNAPCSPAPSSRCSACARLSLSGA